MEKQNESVHRIHRSLNVGCSEKWSECCTNVTATPTPLNTGETNENSTPTATITPQELVKREGLDAKTCLFIVHYLLLNIIMFFPVKQQ